MVHPGSQHLKNDIFEGAVPPSRLMQCALRGQRSHPRGAVNGQLLADIEPASLARSCGLTIRESRNAAHIQRSAPAPTERAHRSVPVLSEPSAPSGPSSVASAFALATSGPARSRHTLRTAALCYACKRPRQAFSAATKRRLSTSRLSNRPRPPTCGRLALLEHRSVGALAIRPDGITA